MEDSSGLAAGPEVSPGTFLSGHAGELHQVWTALGGCGMQPAEELLYLYTAHLYIYTTWPSRHVASGSPALSPPVPFPSQAWLSLYFTGTHGLTVKDWHLTCPVSSYTCWVVLPGLW